LGDVSINSDLVSESAVAESKEEETMDMDKLLQQDSEE
jgi:hypothetical protein